MNAAQNYFDPAQFPYCKVLEASTTAILEELQKAKALPWFDWWERHLYRGTWHIMPFYTDRSERVDAVCDFLPVTAALLAAMPGRRMAGFSLLKAGTRVLPHRGYIPTEDEARLHLPLIIPPLCSITVGGETRQWRLGECLIFNDHLEHSAENLSDEDRVVLLIDVNLDEFKRRVQ